MLFLVGIFGVLLLSSLRFSSDYKEGVLSVDTTGRLEGVLVFVVILSHIAMSDYRLGIGSSSSMLVHVGALGRLAVSVFFFISGYGLLKQLQARKNAYIARFVRHRIMPFMLSYFISALVYYGYYKVLSSIRLADALKSLINGNPFIVNSWFMEILLILYFIFYLSGKICRSHISSTVLLVVTGNILVFLLFYLNSYPHNWYNTVLCFSLGILWALYEPLLGKVMRSKSLYIGTIIFLLVLFLFLFLSRRLEAISSLLFAAIVIMISYTFTFKNSFWKKTKHIGLEMYLYHGLFISLFRGKYLFINNTFIFGASIFLATFLTALVINKLTKLFLSVVQRHAA